MPIREEGTSLAELRTPLVPRALTNATATFVDSLKISSTSEKVRRRRRVVIKRRNIYSEQLADLANLYFRMSGIPIRFWSKAEDWRHWEIKVFGCSMEIVFALLLQGPRRFAPINYQGKIFGNI